MSRIVVLGCGHSGSSLIAGILYFSGYKTLSYPSPTFECTVLNALNEKILENGSKILNYINAKIYLNQIDSYKGGWYIKDPLLPFTIQYILHDYDKTVKVIYIYRHPENNVEHLLRKKKRYHTFLNERDAIRIAEEEWLAKNKAIIRFIRSANYPYLLVEYDKLVDKNKNLISQIRNFIPKSVNFEFVNPSKRKAKKIEVREELHRLYDNIVSMESGNKRYNGSSDTRVGSSICDKVSYLFRFAMWKAYWKGRSVVYPRCPYVRPPFNNYDGRLREIGVLQGDWKSLVDRDVLPEEFRV